MNNIASYIDHTLLKADATPAQIEKLCDEAKKYHFASICVNPSYVSLASELLCGSGVNICCVVGFPLGAATSRTKAFEAADAVCSGAREIDMVINIGQLKAGNMEYVRDDIAEVVSAVRGNALVKVIIEACLLTDEQKAAACRCAVDAGADFVKTSTGFSTGGALIKDIVLMRSAVCGKARIKAAGGIRSYQAAADMINAGADRIGTSNGVDIVEQSKNA